MSVKAKQIRVPVRLVQGHWELLYGGPVVAKEGAVAELRLSLESIPDRKLLEALTKRRVVAILPEDTELRVALTVRPEGMRPELLRLLINGPDFKRGLTADISGESRFVSVVVGKRKATKHEKPTPGGLFLVMEGAEARAIESGVVTLPAALNLSPADSLNHAFTKLSVIFEPWRKAHVGSIYERVFYREADDVWYPLKDLRENALAVSERKLIQTLWKNVASELGRL